MYLIGASGHAKVVIDCLQDAGIKVLGLFDANPSITFLKNFPVIGDYNSNNSEEPLIISVGDNKIRAKIALKLKGKAFGKAIHPSVLLSDDVEVGEGTVVFHGSIIQSSATIGKHVIVNTAASIDHDCVVGDFVHIAPKVALCGGVSIGEGALLGVGAVVIPGVKIGKWSIIGAGSVVTKNVPDYAVVVGNPARILKYNHEV